MSSNPFVYIIGAVAIVGALFVFGGNGNPSPNGSVPTPAGGTNVEIVDGVQIVTIVADGGYAPASSAVKAGVPTVLRFKTENAYDCSSSIRIPALKVRQELPATGTTDVDVGTLAAGTLSGSCSMGMYRFSVVAS